MILLQKALRQRCHQCSGDLIYTQTEKYSKIYCKCCGETIIGSTPEETAINWLKLMIIREQEVEEVKSWTKS